MNPALLIDSKKMGNLSSEKTSATGSNGSHDSPQHNLMSKGKWFGAMGSARKLFALQNAEIASSKQRDANPQERQPLYLQIMAKNGGQAGTSAFGQAPLAEGRPV